MNALVRISARLLAWLEEQHRRWYEGDEARQRHRVEEDARRLGGRVVWEGLQPRASGEISPAAMH